MVFWQVTHMQHQPLPLGEQIAAVLLTPPVITALWWLMSRGFASGVQGGDVTERTKKRQKIEFWVLLTVMYLIAFGMAVYAWFIKGDGR